jgi:AsmA-like C-terminal region/Protein of unknown function
MQRVQVASGSRLGAWGRQDWAGTLGWGRLPRRPCVGSLIDRETSVTRTGGSRSRAGLSANRTLVVRGPDKPRAIGRALPLLAKGVSASILIGVVALGLLYVRVLYGPIALDFLAKPIESAIAEELAGPKVQVESVALGLNDRGLFQFELKNVRISDPDGEVLVAAPSVAVSLSGRAMLKGRIAVESLDLISARLVLFYADDGSLSLKFSPVPHKREGDMPPPPFVPVPAEGATPPASAADGDGMLLGRIDLVKVLAEASARARRGETAGAHLREVGLRSATVIVDNGRRKTVWQVPQFDLDLDHRRTRSSVAGRAKIESAAGPWELTFRSHQHIRAKALDVSVQVQGLVPRGLAANFPHLSALEGLDLPLSGEAKLELSSSGEILSGTIALEAAAGSFDLPGPEAGPMRISGGRIELTYDAGARSFQIGRSSLSWAGGHVQFAGNIAHAGQGNDGPRWTFEVASTEGSVGSDTDGARPLPIDELAASGYFEHGRVVLSRLVARAGGAEASAEGSVADVGSTVEARFDARIGAMPVDLLKTLWPARLAPATRAWIAQRLTRGKVEGGTFTLVREASKSDWTTVNDAGRMTLALEGTNLEFALLEGWPAVEMSRGLLRIENSTVGFSTPEAFIASADGRKFSINGAFAVDLSRPMPRKGTLTLKGHGPLSLAVEMLDRQAPTLLQDAGLALTGADGRVEGDISVSLPIVPQLQLSDATVEGRLRVTDARLRQAVGSLDMRGINVTVDVTAAALEAKGKFLAGNVPATVSWQYVFGAPPDKQPPLRIAATLYESERAELGLDLNDIVQGEVGTEVTVVQDAQGDRHVHVRADLTNAELVLESLAWNKPVGERGVFEFDVVKGSKYPIEYRNVRLDGENIALGGWMGAGQDLRVKEYRFPQFSLNVVSNFEAHGKLRADNVWDVTAKGAFYDGKDLFRSFFSNPAPEKTGKNRPGLDLRAEFESVLGFSGASLRTVRLSLQRRAGKLTQLDARGLLAEGRASPAGNKQLEVGLRPEPGRPRTLSARANDAGLTFKLFGLLPHMVGGDMNLDVNLDSRGATERAGSLTARGFHLLGDEIPVLGADRRRNPVREKVPFEHLHIKFSAGSGQFKLHNADLQGPVFSATGKGTINFTTKLVQIDGTFTPVAGLNQIFRDIPLVGDIITGPKREGMFAWNYALQGGLESPQIKVHPLSGVAPGFTREFFPIMPEEPRPAPRKKSSGGRPDTGERASSSPAAGGPEAPTEPDTADGWLSDKASATKRKQAQPSP